MISYLNQHYANANLVVGIAGAIDDAVVRKVTSYFNSKNAGSSKMSYIKFNPKQNKNRVKIMFKETEQVQIGLGFPAYGYGHKDLYAFQLLTVILGGNMSSRLFVNIRGKQGLCYYIKCQPNVYQDTGNLYIQAGLDKNKLEKAIILILKELNNVIKKGVTEAELQKAKDFIKGKTVLAMEDSLHMAEWYVKQAVFERELLSPEERFKLFDAVAKADILRTAKDIIKGNKVNLAVIGPYKDGREFERLLVI
jgi:predicted Zn-dependent peptidase